MQSLTSSQYHFILRQARNVMNGHTNSADEDVLAAVVLMAIERSERLTEVVSDELKRTIRLMDSIRNREDYEEFRERLLLYVRPMVEVTDKDIKKLFPKVKNLRMPKFAEAVRKELTYLGWNDPGTNRKYFVFEEGDGLTGLYGQFRPSGKKGVCSICNGIDETGLFLTETRHAGGETYTKRGNYICTDSMACNRRLDDRERFDQFIKTVSR
ncbi:Fibronectin-binding protein (FBP), N-terminal [Bhargavaea ginsengi]|uniref:Fibronectin-binding protein (FBP), N-terminal n=1 Tax=Bhargavaea ginsengi TaxID=426757 RepID=A0A1H6WQS3_9BACL|nr:FusB/FusC family EF-G-binding protein [Bhargavaea ginsengi]SEJ14822.1 Fibronectin-binding protein (FBP), N-terminal [Bhargavaea ginsengi]